MSAEVSIIIPCFKQAEYLGESLQSVYDQTFSNWECIIVNDGSPDDTEDVAKAWMTKDSRFKYIRQNNLGVCSARNNGIKKAVGKFILPLDADDIISSNYVAQAYASFKENPSLTLVYCKAKKFGSLNGNWCLPEFSLLNLANENVIFSSALFKKEDWGKIGGYDEKMSNGWEDWEFWIALLKDGGKVKRLEILGFFYRIKDHSRNNLINRESAEEIYRYISVKHAEFFCAHFGSFQSLREKLSEIKKDHSLCLLSEKFAADLFCKRFFGFTIFGKYGGK